MPNKKFALIFGIVLVFLILIFNFIYFFFFTAEGGFWLIQKLFLKDVLDENFSVRSVKGSLSRQLVFDGIEIRDLKGLPYDSVLRIQKINIYFTSFDARGLNVEIQNGRLVLPHSSIFIFDGIYQDSSYDFFVFSPNIDARDIVLLFPEAREIREVSGSISGFECSIKGAARAPELKGKLRLERVVFKDITVIDCPAFFLLKLTEDPKLFKMDGEIILEKGTIVRQSTTVELSPGKILFSGDPGAPSFDLRGKAAIEGTIIHLSLRGTLAKPDFTLTSVPAMPQERLMMMLITGKGWKSTEDALSKGEVTPDLVKDFVDYFFFESLGLKKGVFDKFDVHYDTWKFQGSTIDGAAAAQKLGVTYQLTDGISLGGEKEIRPQSNSVNQTQGDQPLLDNVFLKYKKRF